MHYKNKKRKTRILAALLSLALGAAAVPALGTAAQTKEAQGNGSLIQIQAQEGAKVTVLTDPVQAGQEVTIKVELEAGYRLEGLTVSDEDGVEILMDCCEVGKEIHFRMPTEGKVTVTAQTSESEVELYSKTRALNPGITAITYNAGNRLGNVIPGATRSNVLNWLGQHRNDNYYIGTPYPENTDGTFILGRNGGTDRRCPNGDCSHALGWDDYDGVAMMNCTGFVWHVLYKATGLGYLAAWDQIPAWGGCGAGSWRTYLQEHQVEYRTYQSSSWTEINALLNSVISEGYAQPGDIIWTWDGSVASNGLPSGSSGSHHIGIFTGTYFNKTNQNEWWNSVGFSPYTGEYLGRNLYGLITPKAACVAVTVIRLNGDVTGSAKLKKTSSNPEVSSGNSGYSLAGAEYGVYTDADCTNKVGTLTTDANGDSNTINLNAGTYYVKETKASKGFKLDKQKYTATVAMGQTTVIQSVEVPEIAPVSMLLKKQPQGTQGNDKEYDMSGALFEVKYYDEKDTALAKPIRTWIFRTNEKGEAYYSADCRESGDELYKVDGELGIPIGTVLIQEIKPPEGFLLDSKPQKVTITAGSVSGMEAFYNTPTFKEPVLNLTIVKLLKGTQTPIKGAVFRHTMPDGTTEEVMTDADGRAVIEGLAWGNHTLEEISAPAGYQVNPGKLSFTVEEGTNKITVTSNTSEAGTGSMTFTVQDDGNALLEVEDILSSYQLKLHKENEQGTLLSGAEFILYTDADCNNVFAKGTTAADGTLKFTGLTVGTDYYLKETKAPEGYRIPADGNGKALVYAIRAQSGPQDGKFEYYVNGKLYTEGDDGYEVTGTGEDRTINLTVINTTGIRMPETGNAWTAVIILAGAAFMIAALIYHRKRGKMK